jgi:hypothetical protein
VGSPIQRPLSTLDSLVQVQYKALLTSLYLDQLALLPFPAASQSLKQSLTGDIHSASDLGLAEQISSQWTANLHRRRTFRKSQLSSVVSTRYVLSCVSQSLQLTFRTGKLVYQLTTMLLRNQQKRLQTQIHSSAHSFRTALCCESLL